MSKHSKSLDRQNLKEVLHDGNHTSGHDIVFTRGSGIISDGCIGINSCGLSIRNNRFNVITQSADIKICGNSTTYIESDNTEQINGNS